MELRAPWPLVVMMSSQIQLAPRRWRKLIGWWTVVRTVLFAVEMDSSFGGHFGGTFRFLTDNATQPASFGLHSGRRRCYVLTVDGHAVL